MYRNIYISYFVSKKKETKGKKKTTETKEENEKNVVVVSSICGKPNGIKQCCLRIWSVYFKLKWSNREFLLFVHMKLMLVMCNKRNQSLLYNNNIWRAHFQEWKWKKFIKINFCLLCPLLKFYVYVMCYYEILWFYQDFKKENLCFLNLSSVYAATILGLSLEIMLSPLTWTEHLCNCKDLSFMSEQASYLFLGGQIHQWLC